MDVSKPSITLAIEHKGSKLREETFAGEAITAGRSEQCQIVLDDKYVSWKHFRLDWDGDRYRFVDLGSSNGSMVNGERTKETLLKEGDTIAVGETRLLVRRVAPGAVGTEDARERTAEAAVRPSARLEESEFFFEKVLERMHHDLTVIGQQHRQLAEQIAKLPSGEARDRMEAAHEAVWASLRSLEGSLRSLHKDNRRLKALHAAVAMINRVTDLKARLNAILDMAIEIMEADCGFLILYDEKSRKISVALQRGMPMLDQSPGVVDTLVATSPTPSLSIAREVLRTRRPIVVADLRRGSQFDSAQSIMAQGVLAVLCAPLIFDNELIGLIYVDFREIGRFADRRIGPGDRELFEALASLAATAIQNAKFFRNIRVEVERRSNLQRYLSPELVEQVIRRKRPVNLGAARRHSSVLFCDIRDFTSFAEETPADRLIRQLNRYFSLMLRAITAENGSVDKFLGDGLMAFFGPLVELDNSEVAAVRAACSMQRLMAEANREWRDQGWRCLRIGIGISAGEVVAGNLGSPERLEYTVIGDTVNIASRLSAVARPGQILVTKSVAECLPAGEFDIHPLDPVALKGKSDKVRVYEVAY